MNEVIIQRFNEITKPGDILYILGDCGNLSNDPTNLLRRIKCPKILIIGNHDTRWVKYRHFRNVFVDIAWQQTIQVGDDHIVLSHYPLADWERSQEGWWHLYGHIHEYANVPAREYMKSLPNCWNVGVDSNSFKPLSFKEIKELKEVSIK